MSEITPNTPNPVREDAYKQQLAAKLGIDPQYIPGSPIWHSEEEIAAIAEMFSNMAGGGSSGGRVLVVHGTQSGDDIVLDKTCKEIWDAMKSGGVVIDGGTSLFSITSAGIEEGVYAFATSTQMEFVGEGDNENPVWNNGGGGGGADG